MLFLSVIILEWKLTNDIQLYKLSYLYLDLIIHGSLVYLIIKAFLRSFSCFNKTISLGNSNFEVYCSILS